MRGCVDDRALAGLMGADPIRANRVAWILGTQLAAVGGILIAPELTLDATQLSLLIVSAYTAAVFGRLRSLPLTFVGAIVVGCLESYLTGYLPPNSVFLTGLRLAAPALLLSRRCWSSRTGGCEAATGGCARSRHRACAGPSSSPRRPSCSAWCSPRC